MECKYKTGLKIVLTLCRGYTYVWKAVVPGRDCRFLVAWRGALLSVVSPSFGRRLSFLWRNRGLSSRLRFRPRDCLACVKKISTNYSQLSNKSTGTIEKNLSKSLAVLTFPCGTIGMNSRFLHVVLLFQRYCRVNFGRFKLEINRNEHYLLWKWYIKVSLMLNVHGWWLIALVLKCQSIRISK